MRRALVFLALLGAALMLPARPASAHPLGNFTVNQFSGIVVRPGAVDVEVVVDMAEIPTFQTRVDIDTDGDGHVSPAEAAAYRERGCSDLTGGLALQVDGRPQRLGVRSGAVSFPPGQAGLPTLRLRCDLEARTGERAGGGPGRVTFANTNFADRVGWREITAAGEGVRLVASDVPVHSTSHRLTRYPDDLLQSPLDQRHA
ncbi:MAG: nickel transporter, partial [Acidimicrobiia bacterium]